MKSKLEKIMYIEDDKDIAQIAQIALVDIGGFDLRICHSGKEAIQIASQFQPDLFIIDVMMPEMDGPLTMKALRQLPLFVETPILFMTAKSQVSEINQYLAQGALGVITKPFDPLTLADQVKQLWHDKVVRNEENIR